MYIVTKEQIEENRKKYKSKEDYLEQMKNEFRKEIKVKPYTVDDIRELLIENIKYILKYNLIPKEYINNSIEYINSLSEDKVYELNRLYQKESSNELKEMVKKGLIVPFN